MDYTKALESIEGAIEWKEKADALLKTFFSIVEERETESRMAGIVALVLAISIAKEENIECEGFLELVTTLWRRLEETASHRTKTNQESKCSWESDEDEVEEYDHGMKTEACWLGFKTIIASVSARACCSKRAALSLIVRAASFMGLTLDELITEVIDVWHVEVEEGKMEGASHGAGSIPN